MCRSYLNSERGIVNLDLIKKVSFRFGYSEGDVTLEMSADKPNEIFESLIVLEHELPENFVNIKDKSSVEFKTELKRYVTNTVSAYMFKNEKVWYGQLESELKRAVSEFADFWISEECGENA